MNAQLQPMHNLASIVHDYSKVRALVIGDAILDQYHFGRVDRICPEAPVPIFLEDYDRAETRRGGADNVAHQLEVLGCQVNTVFAARRSVKHRYFAGHHLVFRRDSDSTRVPTVQDYQTALRYLQETDVVVLSDYAKGWLTRDMCQLVMSTGIPVVVDPKGTDWTKYQGATVICPNTQEMVEGPCGATGAVIVQKQGPKGLTILNGNYAFSQIAATAQQVYDVTGAGDTVTALIAASLGVGATVHDAAVIANAAAGVVVGKLGTAVCTKEELLCALA